MIRLNTTHIIIQINGTTEDKKSSIYAHIHIHGIPNKF